MRLAFVVASLAALALTPADGRAQDRDRDRDRERRRERERDRQEREHERREEERERRARDREDRVQIRVYHDRYRSFLPSRNVTLAVGVLNYDFAGQSDDNFPMAALRGDWRLTRFLRSEVDATYALGDVADATAPDGERSTSLATATAGVQAELPFRYLRPYAGVAVGLFGRFDDDEEGSEGESSVRPTTAFPVGLRFTFSPRLALRAEVRFRFDQHDNDTTAADREQTVGLSFRF
jgi:hypothetical protein